MPVNIVTRFKVYAKYNYQCQSCGKHLTERTSTIEHVLPRSYGGNNCESNLTLLCYGCNSYRRNDMYLPRHYYNCMSDKDLRHFTKILSPYLSNRPLISPSLFILRKHKQLQFNGLIGVNSVSKYTLCDEKDYILAEWDLTCKTTYIDIKLISLTDWELYTILVEYLLQSILDVSIYGSYPCNKIMLSIDDNVKYLRFTKKVITMLGINKIEEVNFQGRVYYNFELPKEESKYMNTKMLLLGYNDMVVTRDLEAITNQLVKIACPEDEHVFRSCLIRDAFYCTSGEAFFTYLSNSLKASGSPVNVDAFYSAYLRTLEEHVVINSDIMSYASAFVSSGREVGIFANMSYAENEYFNRKTLNLFTKNNYASCTTGFLVGTPESLRFVNPDATGILLAESNGYVCSNAIHAGWKTANISGKEIETLKSLIGTL